MNKRYLAIIAIFVVTQMAWAADIGKGKLTYGAKCASCHGPSAKGNPAMAKMFKVDAAALNLVDQETGAKKDEELTTTIIKGKGGKMPAFDGKLKADEIADVLAYIRSLGAAPAVAATEAKAPPAPAANVDAAGAKLFAAKCASCHGKDAKGSPAMAKMFKVDAAALNLVDQETGAKKDEELTRTTQKGKGKMPSFAGKLKDEEIGSIISYLRSLK
ncbi:MAG: c-type cytochrome [Elusimicrobia bacterium]|nr:c-type cytochrome [Elusimicrobiota bacterium]